ncbi:hypothetical protein SprV_0602224900 [Sparganum proliferum]
MSSLRWLILLQTITLLAALDFGLVPTEFTATALNSSAIRVTWNKPSRSAELSGKYELIVYNSTHEDEFTLPATEDIITDLEPSTTYNLTVRAYWSNDTLVDAVAFTSVTTRPRVQHSVYNDFEMCSSELEPCTEIKKINGTFDAF